MTDTSIASGQRLGRSPSVKLFAVALMTIAMILPLYFIALTLWERQDRAQEAAVDIASGWAHEQSIAGIYLYVPYEVTETGPDAVMRTTRNIAILFPGSAAITANARTQRRSRGIYDVTVYTADIALRADFPKPSLAGIIPENAKILWQDAAAVVGISDPRGLQEDATLSVNGRGVPFAPGSGAAAIPSPSIHAPLGLTAAPEVLVLQTSLTLHGSSQLSFAPLGSDTTVRILSPWRDPSFFGAFLPTGQQIGARGFDANWRIPYLARGFGQSLSSADGVAQILKTDFGVRFYQSVDFYQLIGRSLKYGVLFVGLAFTAFFVVELLTEKRLHVVQYALIGSVQVLFYLLLLSIAEHLGFDGAYVIAALATIALTTAYAKSALASSRQAAILFAVLSALYGVLYILLQVEDYALLIGASILFLALALTMLLTRKVDWYQAAKFSGAN